MKRASSRDQEEQIKQGIAEQNGFMIANFAGHNTPSGIVKGKPTVVSKDAKDVISDADVIIMPLPSFAYPSTLEGYVVVLQEQPG